MTEPEKLFVASLLQLVASMDEFFRPFRSPARLSISLNNFAASSEIARPVPTGSSDSKYSTIFQRLLQYFVALALGCVAGAADRSASEVQTAVLILMMSGFAVAHRSHSGNSSSLGVFDERFTRYRRACALEPFAARGC